MTLTLQEMSDRFEIQDLLVAYCYAVDNQDFDALDHVFAPGAIIDYSEMVGVKGQLPEIKAFLKESLGSVKAFLHSVSTTQYTIRSEEHTSELQSLMRISYAVFCLKKKHKKMN